MGKFQVIFWRIDLTMLLSAPWFKNCSDENSARCRCDCLFFSWLCCDSAPLLFVSFSRIHSLRLSKTIASFSLLACVCFCFLLRSKHQVGLECVRRMSCHHVTYVVRWDAVHWILRNYCLIFRLTISQAKLLVALRIWRNGSDIAPQFVMLRMYV
jgi:multisubunit Na+/H+ antiporter MnhE subunit